MNFNSIFIIPTGINCEIGGHAGDATCYLKMISELCDNVITHPNVVNASDINEMPENCLYVEGSTLDKFLKGEIKLKKTRKNKILALIENFNKESVITAINTVQAAEVLLGADIDFLKFKPIKMKGFVENGEAKGEIENIENLLEAIDSSKGPVDCMAINSFVCIDKELRESYNNSSGKIPNPWGRVEALLTHKISSIYGVQSAHAPMSLETSSIVSDKRISAEMISNGFFFSVLKGLHKAPKISNEGLGINEIDAIIIPEGVTNSYLDKNKTKIIQVKNKNSYSFNQKKYKSIICNNYLEVCGVLSCLKQGISLKNIKGAKCL